MFITKTSVSYNKEYFIIAVWQQHKVSENKILDIW
jgi:hypothetical protein